MGIFISSILGNLAVAQAADNLPTVTVAGSETTITATDRAHSVALMLNRARVAVALNHYASPPGDNAVELYLEILDLDAENATAIDGLVDMYIPAVYQIDGAVASGRYKDAERMISLLDRARPGSVLVSALRKKLLSKVSPSAR